MSSEKLYTAKVENLAYRGLGVARLEGKVVFLPFTAPGDTVTYALVKEFPRHALGVVREVLEEGSGRTTPPCRFFQRCGGCHLQHLTYEEQLCWKERWVSDALMRIAGITEAEDHIKEIIRSPRSFGYRNKASLHVMGEAIGFLAQGSDEVIDIDACPVLLPVLEKTLAPLRAWIMAHARRTKPFRVVVRVGDSNHGVMVFHTDLLREEKVVELKKTIPDFRVGCGGVLDTVSYGIGAVTFRVRPGTFFQVNSLLRAEMTELVRRLAGRGRHLIDGHAGVGWPSLCLADQFERVSAVEVSRGARSLGERNAAAAGVGHVRFFGGTIFSVMKGGMLDPEPDVVLLDPPRIGLRVQDLESVVRLKPERIVYISCDPSTLARDTRRFVSHGFSIESVHPIDLFPQTYHVESVALLHRQ